jgi:hypothetical protein
LQGLLINDLHTSGPHPNIGTLMSLMHLCSMQVSAGTCVVLAETLSSNTALAAVILQVGVS